MLIRLVSLKSISEKSLKLWYLLEITDEKSIKKNADKGLRCNLEDCK